MSEQNQSPREINKITGFFRTRKSKYIFVILEDERLLNDILVPVIDTYEKKGLEVRHFPLKLTDYYVFQQIAKSAYHSGLQGLIVSGLNELIEKYGETFIDNLNRSRDAFQRLAVPIIWIIDQKNLQRIIRGASDFYQMRDLPDFHIQGAAKDTIPRLDINFFYNPYPGDKDIDVSYLEKQLAGIPAGSKYEKETINGFVLPLLRLYIQEGDTQKMKNLYWSFLKNHEEIVNDPYVLVAYYTAMGELDQSPLFPRHMVQPIFPGNDLAPGEDLHSEGLIKHIAEKKGAVVVTGDDCRMKSQLLTYTLGKLQSNGFDLIVIYGETTPELILFNIALKAKERNDLNALKIVTGPQDIRGKKNYFSEGFLARDKIAIIWMHFEENQSEAFSGECKSRRLRLFLNSLCESLKGKESFLLISTCFTIKGFSNYPIPGDRDMAVTRKKVEELPPRERNILDILSLFQKPVHPGVLRFYDINPENRDVFYNLEKSLLIEIITYPGEENKENIRLYVPSFVSRLMQKSLDEPKKTAFHLRAGRYFENYFPLEEAGASYIETLIEARRHFIAAKAWDNAAELTLKLFWPLHAQNFTQWALDLLNELEIEALTPHLKYHVQRRLGLLHYYRGAYFLSWENYKEALALVRDEDERYRLYSEILPVELSVNPGFNSNDRSVFKGIFHSLADPPPLEIIKAGTTAIYHYYKEIQIKATYFLECKIFLVGSGDVGKTTLMKKLKDNHFVVEPGKEDTTRGVDIQPWQLSCPFPDGKVRNVNIHFWDFGGQDILHATHQFFLTKRSLYLFVWDPRKEEEIRSFDYWLNVVKLFGAGSPLIMVMNKVDIRSKHIDEASFQDKFPNIIQFHQVSCLTGQQIPELTETIRTSLCQMPHLLDKLPKSWLDIRNDLKAKVENYITLDDYFAICRNHGMDNQKALFLSEYLHDLGIILHFHQDPVLAGIVILKTEWATGPVYALIDSLEIQQNKGRFNRVHLDRYWDKKKYPAEKYPQLLRLIEKFELCFNIVGTDEYIIPELLPSQRPAFDVEVYRVPGNLHLHYAYDFMPAGVITRFISRIYYLIKNDHYWKNGVELEFSGSSALVVGDSAQKRIRISVTGTNNTQLMGIIRSHFDHIHETLNMKKEEHVFEEVPCICSKCAASEKPFFYKYHLLQILKAKKRDALCEKSSEDVSVSRLLNGLL